MLRAVAHVGDNTHRKRSKRVTVAVSPIAKAEQVGFDGLSYSGRDQFIVLDPVLERDRVLEEVDQRVVGVVEVSAGATFGIAPSCGGCGAPSAQMSNIVTTFDGHELTRAAELRECRLRDCIDVAQVAVKPTWGGRDREYRGIDRRRRSQEANGLGYLVVRPTSWCGGCRRASLPEFRCCRGRCRSWPAGGVRAGCV